MDQILTVISFDPSVHYPIVVQWWRDHGFPVLPLDFLPPTGFVVCFGGVPISAGFLIKSDTPIIWLEWIVADKKADPVIRDRSIHFLIHYAMCMALQLGYRCLYTGVVHEGLKKRLMQSGFVEGDKPSMMIWRI